MAAIASGGGRRGVEKRSEAARKADVARVIAGRANSVKNGFTLTASSLVDWRISCSFRQMMQQGK